MLSHMDSAYNLARWITGHDQDAEDVVQEVYIRAFRGFEKYTDINSLSWLLTSEYGFNLKLGRVLRS